MKLTILFTFILIKAVSFSQEELNWNFPNDYGKTLFTMGKSAQPSSEKVAVRIDTMLFNFNAYPAPIFSFQTPHGEWRKINLCELNPVANKQTSTSTKEIDLSGIDTNYSRKGLNAGYLIAYGNVDLPSFQANKVEWLDFNPEYGRISGLEKYRNLRGIILAEKYIGSIENYSFDFIENEKLNGTRFQYLGYLRSRGLVGDPFFWQDVQGCKKLEALYLPYQQYRNDLLFLDEEFAPIFTNGNMKSLYVDKGISYMPVNFHYFGSLNSLYFMNLLVPEAVNLAIVMNSYNKDTTASNNLNWSDESNWSQFLIAAKEKTISIPENGTFTTHYMNDQVLCNGTFKNNQPDGKWEFYYDNGHLCEQRFYSAGQKTGNWIFLSQYGDTLYIFRYKDGHLTYRENRENGSKHACENMEISANVVIKTIYELDWKAEHDVTISRKEVNLVSDYNWENHQNIGDTIQSGVFENWHFTDQEWEYTFTGDCRGTNYIEKEYQKGNIGEMAYIGGNTFFAFYNEGKQTNEEIKVNFKTNTAIEIKSDDDNPEEVMREVSRKNIDISIKHIRTEKEERKRLKKESEE